MVTWFAKLKAEQKDLFILAMVALIVFAFLVPLFFFNSSSWPLGWLLGSVVSLIGYLTLSRFASSMLSNDAPKASSTISGVAFAFLRFTLYAAALIVSAICTFKSEWFGGFSGFNFFAVALSFLPMPIVLISSNLIRNKKSEKVPSSEGDKK